MFILLSSLSINPVMQLHQTSALLAHQQTPRSPVTARCNRHLRTLSFRDALPTTQTVQFEEKDQVAWSVWRVGTPPGYCFVGSTQSSYIYLSTGPGRLSDFILTSGLTSFVQKFPFFIQRGDWLVGFSSRSIAIHFCPIWSISRHFCTPPLAISTRYDCTISPKCTSHS